MSSSIEFKLFAPYNKSAALIGSFNDWKETQMTKGEDGYFRTSVDLEDGVYQYKFRVQSKSWFLEPDQWVEIIDPYIVEIDAATIAGVLRVKDGKRIIDTYVWQHDDKPLADNHQLVLYELHVADFSNSEANPQKQEVFKRAIEKLDHLAELGINAIELMPLNEHPGDYKWGYLVSHFFAVENSYGPPEDLKRFIDECHARGIRVIIDGIYNHSAEESPLLKIDRDYWYYHSGREHKKESDYWGPEFNYENYDEKLGIRPAWEFVGDVVRYWIQEYHIDGIRFDAVSQLTALDVDKPNFDFINWITQETKKTAGNKPFYNIAECIPEEPKLIVPKGPMDGCWHASFHMFMLEHLCSDTFDVERLKEVLDPKRQNYGNPTGLVNYLASHDQERVLKQLGDIGIFDEAAFRIAKLGAVILMTAVGVPMIWMGEEFGEYKPKAKSTDRPNPIEWNLLENNLNRDLFEFHKRLIALRKKNPALQTDNVEFFHEDPDNKVLAYVRWNDEGSRVAVVANFSDKHLAGYNIPNFPANGTSHEWTGNYDVEANDNQLMIDLGGQEAKVFVC